MGCPELLLISNIGPILKSEDQITLDFIYDINAAIESSPEKANK